MISEFIIKYEKRSMEPLKKTYNPGSLKTPIKADSMNAFLKMNYLAITVFSGLKSFSPEQKRYRSPA